MLKYILLCLLVILSGCDVISGMVSESHNLSEYSILQSYAHRCIDLENSAQYVIVDHALKFKHAVIGFPIRGKETGYVVMLAQAEGDPKTKSLPEVDFVVTESAFEAVKARTKLSPEIERFIAAHIK